MARSKVEQVAEEVSEAIDIELVTTAPDDWEFETVRDESPTRVIFEEFGDTFVGQFSRLDHITPDNGKDDPFDLWVYYAQDGKPYAVNDSYAVRQGMKDVLEGQWVRLTYVKDIPSSKGNDVKDIKVEVRKDKAAIPAQR